MFVKIKGILNLIIIDLKVTANNCLLLTLNSIADTLKIIAVFSDYEYKTEKLSIMLRWKLYSIITKAKIINNLIIISKQPFISLSITI